RRRAQLRAAARALQRACRCLAAAGAGRPVERRARLLVRGDRRRGRHARRHGEVPRAPGPRAVERAARRSRRMSAPTLPFGREVIESLIPHRPPFLLVDEILELEPGKRVVGRREIRADDWWFPGHFPERPVMPGVLTIEAIAQAGAVAVLADEANAGKLP